MLTVHNIGPCALIHMHFVVWVRAWFGQSVLAMIALYPREQFSNKRVHYLLSSQWQRFNTAVNSWDQIFQNSSRQSGSCRDSDWTCSFGCFPWLHLWILCRMICTRVHAEAKVYPMQYSARQAITAMVTQMFYFHVVVCLSCVNFLFFSLFYFESAFSNLLLQALHFLFFEPFSPRWLARPD